MTHDESFAVFQARRAAERADAARSFVSWRKAILPGSAPADPLGYVAYCRASGGRGYAREIPGGYEVGRIDRSILVRLDRGEVRTLDGARKAATRIALDPPR